MDADTLLAGPHARAVRVRESRDVREAVGALGLEPCMDVLTVRNAQLFVWGRKAA